MENLKGTDEGQQGQVFKRRAACDECRTKKLKCTGEQPACSRCVREHLECVYSAQKQMGRPKKRQRTSEEEISSVHRSGNISRAGSDSFAAHQTFNTGSNGVLDSASFQGVPLQPWMPSADSADGWNFGDMASAYPSEYAIPDLTPDSASNSPPALNLPPEPQNINGHSNGSGNMRHDSYGYGASANSNTSTGLLLDPSLISSNNGLTSSELPNCACLSNLYLTLSNLQSMDPNFTFPFALHPLREAMRTAHDTLHCAECPQRFISAIQNTQMLGTLLMSLAERFGKILAAITREAERVGAAGEKKKLRLADLNTSTSHLHSNGLGCVAAFSIDLDAGEWRAMAKKVVRAEIYGPSEGNECCPFFTGILNEMEKRQFYWHDRPVPEDFPRDPRTGEILGGKNLPKEEHLCLKYVAYARQLVEGLDWT